MQHVFAKDVKELPEVAYVPIKKCFVPNPLVSFRFFGKKGLLMITLNNVRRGSEFEDLLAANGVCTTDGGIAGNTQNENWNSCFCGTRL